MLQKGDNRERQHWAAGIAAWMLWVAALVFSSSALAGVQIITGCPDLHGVRVETRQDTRLSSFVELSKPQAGDDLYLITYNPKFSDYYFNRHTQQWLYLRQCAHVALGHDFELLSRGRQNPRWERDADCWAIKQMEADDKYRFSYKSVRTLERDLANLKVKGKKDRKARTTWTKLFGSRTSIDLESCTKTYLRKQ